MTGPDDAPAGAPTSPVDGHPPGTTDAAARLWATGDVAATFTSDRRVVPWRSAPRRKGEPLVAPEQVAALLAGGPSVVDVDPRPLHATQPWVVGSHAAHYVTGVWETTGTTSADRASFANRYPLVHVDDRGRAIILAGHHRSFVALVSGRPVRARVLRPPGTTTVAVLPRLLAGPGSPVPHRAVTDPDEAATAIRHGTTVLVPTLAHAEPVLVALGLTPDLVADRLAMAEHGRCLLDR